MDEKYGVLINQDTKLQRSYFQEMCRLRGINAKYQYPLSNKDYTTQGELTATYSEPEDVWCIFNEHVDQKTTHKLGWISELQTEASLISVSYDLHDIQIGCLFDLPAAFDDAPRRLFRVVELSTIAIYPASITCRVVPEYKTEIEKSLVKDFTVTNFNLLREG